MAGGDGDAKGGIGEAKGEGGCDSVLNAVTDVITSRAGGLNTGALVGTTEGATGGASAHAGFADKSTGGSRTLVVTGVGIRRLDSSVDSVARWSNSDGRL